MTDSGEHSAKIRILVLDEQPLLRHGISAYLNSQPDMVVCGEGDSLLDAASKIAEYQPQFLVTELRLAADDSLKLLKRLKTENRVLRILVYSAFDESIFAERAMRAGAAGYVMKIAPGEELTAAIRNIVRDGIYVSREVALSGFRKSLQLPSNNKRSPRSADALENLSDREMHVFQLLGSGLGTKQIAQSLDLSVKTIESHRENIKHKLRLSSGTQLRERAAKWVKETSGGMRRPPRLRLHTVGERKRSHWTCRRRPVGDAHASHSSESFREEAEAASKLQQCDQQQPPSGSDPVVSLHVPESAGAVPS